jgi:hypothetical protein
MFSAALSSGHAGPDASLGAGPRAARNAGLLESLNAAVDELRQLFGPDSTAETHSRRS